MFFEQEVDGLWQIAYFGYGAFAAHEDELAPLRMFPDAEGEWLAPMAEMREAIQSAPTAQPDPAMESALGCQPYRLLEPARVADYVSLSTAVALVTVIDAGEPQRMRVDELIRGQLAAEFTLNDRWITDSELGGCQPRMETARHRHIQGDQYLVFVTVDDFGVAEYRPVAWGKAIASVNERFVTWGLPTLADVRVATGHPAVGVIADAAIEQTQDDDAQSSAADAGEDDGDGRAVWMTTAGVGVVAMVVVVGWVVWRRQGREL